MFVALVLFGLPYKIIYNHIFHPLSSYPGPFFAGVTRIWIAWHNYVEDETVTRRDLMQKHGQLLSQLSIQPDMPFNRYELQAQSFALVRTSSLWQK